MIDFQDFIDLTKPKQPNKNLYKMSFESKAQGTFWKRGQKECKSPRIIAFTVRLCLLEMLEATHIKSH